MQVLFGLSYAFGQPWKIAFFVLFGFGGLMAAAVALYLFHSLHRKTLLALYLCTLGMCVICSVCPEEAPKQVFAVFLGVGLFFLIRLAFRGQKWRKMVGYGFLFGGMWLLWVTLLIGTEVNGAKSWLSLGSYAFQPSEIAKLSLLFAGSIAVEKGKGAFFFLYGIACCAFLGLMGDFGTALIYFAVFCTLLFLASRPLGVASLLGGGIAGIGVSQLVPRIKGRFAAWRHIWEDPIGSGYQQTRALSALASGGLLGLGANRGQLPKIFSAASDLATATLGEQWGLFSVTAAVAAILSIADTKKKNACAIGAAVLLLTQTALNFFGMVDILPFTGVTFPFLSNGGSAMVCAWGLLEFLEAEDEN
ncbi:MAG: FtsW/RodA/SpoVE family cell cycle protein [Ruminococcaceae bacterium]|nr:FtsW/RodA/SpoVE family cell cycle protein [Oscillospiraceae bacterium]